MEREVSYRQAGRLLKGHIIRGRVSERSQSNSAVEQTDQFSRASLSQTTSTSPIPPRGALGCIGKSKRFKPRQHATLAPGPGSYTWNLESSRKSTKSAFLSKEGRSVSPAKPSPAPGQYDPRHLASERSIGSVFRSHVKRIADDPKPVGPSPWHYTPSFAQVQRSASALTSSFRVAGTTRRFQVNIYDSQSTVQGNGTPGPGSYELTRESFSARPSAVFMSGDCRFPQSTAALPAPDAYAAAPKQREEKEAAAGAVFKSGTERLKLSASQRPGPAFYRPLVPPKRQSFLLNLRNHWVG